MRTATYRLNNKSLRSKLKVRVKPYFTTLTAGLSLGFVQRGTGRAGTWVSRLQTGERIVSESGSHSTYKTKRLGEADDLPGMIADGLTVLTFDQASAMARQHAAEIAHGPVRKAMTVREAVNNYIDHLAQRDGAECRHTAGKLRQHVLSHEIADIEVNRLSLSTLQSWQLSLITRDANDPDRERRAKDSANRILTCLKAALNRAYDHRSETGVVDCSAWGKSFRQFRNVAAPRTQHFTPDQVRQLVDAAEPSFANVLKAGFYCGLRPGELCELRVRDVKPTAKQLCVTQGKTGPRMVTLTSEATQFFVGLTRGKLPDAYLLVQPNGAPWNTDAFSSPMWACVVAAGLHTMAELSAMPKRERPSMYSLRHSYASRAIEGGMSLFILAQNLGNSVSMLEKNYVKILDAKRRELIEAHAPSLNVVNGVHHG